MSQFLILKPVLKQAQSLKKRGFNKAAARLFSLNKTLDQAIKAYQVTKNKPQFIEQCRIEINQAKKELSRHRGWIKLVLTGFVSFLFSLFSLGILNILRGKNWLFSHKTRSTLILLRLEKELRQALRVESFLTTKADPSIHFEEIPTTTTLENLEPTTELDPETQTETQIIEEDLAVTTINTLPTNTASTEQRLESTTQPQVNTEITMKGQAQTELAVSGLEKPQPAEPITAYLAENENSLQQVAQRLRDADSPLRPTLVEPIETQILEAAPTLASLEKPKQEPLEPKPSPVVLEEQNRPLELKPEPLILIQEAQSAPRPEFQPAPQTQELKAESLALQETYRALEPEQPAPALSEAQDKEKELKSEPAGLFQAAHREALIEPELLPVVVETPVRGQDLMPEPGVFSPEAQKESAPKDVAAPAVPLEQNGEQELMPEPRAFSPTCQRKPLPEPGVETVFFHSMPESAAFFQESNRELFLESKEPLVLQAPHFLEETPPSALKLKVAQLSENQLLNNLQSLLEETPAAQPSYSLIETKQSSLVAIPKDPITWNFKPLELIESSCYLINFKKGAEELCYEVFDLKPQIQALAPIVPYKDRIGTLAKYGTLKVAGGTYFDTKLQPFKQAGTMLLQDAHTLGKSFFDLISSNSVERLWDNPGLVLDHHYSWNPRQARTKQLGQQIQRLTAKTNDLVQTSLIQMAHYAKIPLAADQYRLVDISAHPLFQDSLNFASAGTNLVNNLIPRVQLGLSNLNAAGSFKLLRDLDLFRQKDLWQFGHQFHQQAAGYALCSGLFNLSKDCIELYKNAGVLEHPLKQLQLLTQELIKSSGPWPKENLDFRLKTYAVLRAQLIGKGSNATLFELNIQTLLYNAMIAPGHTIGSLLGKTGASLSLLITNLLSSSKEYSWYPNLFEFISPGITTDFGPENKIPFHFVNKWIWEKGLVPLLIERPSQAYFTALLRSKADKEISNPNFILMLHYKIDELLKNTLFNPLELASFEKGKPPSSLEDTEVLALEAIEEAAQRTLLNPLSNLIDQKTGYREFTTQKPKSLSETLITPLVYLTRQGVNLFTDRVQELFERINKATCTWEIPSAEEIDALNLSKDLHLSMHEARKAQKNQLKQLIKKAKIETRGLYLLSEQLKKDLLEDRNEQVHPEFMARNQDFQARLSKLIAQYQHFPEAEASIRLLQEVPGQIDQLLIEQSNKKAHHFYYSLFILFLSEHQEEQRGLAQLRHLAETHCAHSFWFKALMAELELMEKPRILEELEVPVKQEIEQEERNIQFKNFINSIAQLKGPLESLQQVQLTDLKLSEFEEKKRTFAFLERNYLELRFPLDSGKQGFIHSVHFCTGLMMTVIKNKINQFQEQINQETGQMKESIVNALTVFFKPLNEQNPGPYRQEYKALLQLCTTVPETEFLKDLQQQLLTYDSFQELVQSASQKRTLEIKELIESPPSGPELIGIIKLLRKEKNALEKQLMSLQRTCILKCIEKQINQLIPLMNAQLELELINTIKAYNDAHTRTKTWRKNPFMLHLSKDQYIERVQDELKKLGNCIAPTTLQLMTARVRPLIQFPELIFAQSPPRSSCRAMEV